MYKSEISTAIRRNLVSNDFGQLFGQLHGFGPVGVPKVGLEKHDGTHKGLFWRIFHPKQTEKFTNMPNDDLTADPFFFSRLSDWFWARIPRPNLTFRCICLLSTEHSKHGCENTHNPAKAPRESVKRASNGRPSHACISPLIRAPTFRLRHITGLSHCLYLRVGPTFHIVHAAPTKSDAMVAGRYCFDNFEEH